MSVFRKDGSLVPHMPIKDSGIINTYWMPYEEYAELDEVFCQRDTEGRLSRAQKHLHKLLPEHCVVHVCRLLKDDFVLGKKYKAGHLFRVDSNTRALNWSVGGSDSIPSHLFVIEYSFEDTERIRECYNTFDSPDSVERNQEKLYGILSGMYNYTPKSQKLIKGQILTALNKASHFYFPDLWNQTSVRPDSLCGQVGAFRIEIMHLDNYMRDSSSWDQALVCAALMAIKKYGDDNDLLNEALTYINDRAADTRGKEWDGVSHIVDEWKTNKFFPSKDTKWDVLNRTVSYCLYWIDKYIKEEKGTKPGHGWDKVAFKYKDQTVTSLNRFLAIAP
jgi:hypothetical protein